MLGEYLLDVADRVLQHEIEGRTWEQSLLRRNSIGLNSRSIRPHILPGSSDLQGLVHRMIFQHVERSKLSFDRRDAHTSSTVTCCECNDSELWEPLRTMSLLIATPACDLAREAEWSMCWSFRERSLRWIRETDWSYGATITKTPIFESGDGSTALDQVESKGPADNSRHGDS